MTRAGGQSIHQLLTGSDQERQREAAAALLMVAVPFFGWLLLCKSTAHIAHVDPHAGNFRWDPTSHTLWVLDWGSHVILTDERRQALCLLVKLLAEDAQDAALATAARAFGLSGIRDAQLALLVKGIFNVYRNASAQDAMHTAAMDRILEDVGDDIVPIIRCLATLGGTLMEMQRKIQMTCS